MPSQRAPHQKAVLVMMRESFVDQIDAAVNRMGFNDRASLIRQAVIEKMAREGIVLPRELATAPDRSGKGGRPRKASPEPRLRTAGSFLLNERPEEETDASPSSDVGKKGAAASYRIPAKRKSGKSGKASRK
ncbi:MAG TPA: hypothetical protein VIM58_04230 [Candidatus Methylacidiphilales bacterium]